MIKGFGHSVWAVPHNYKDIQRKYNMKHIPHVTISTNHAARPIITNYSMPCIITFNKIKDLKRLPPMYTHDPFKHNDCAGFYCKIPNVKEDVLTHMTISYDFTEGNYAELQAPGYPLQATIMRADTTSLNPEEWFFY